MFVLVFFDEDGQNFDFIGLWRAISRIPERIKTGKSCL